MTDELKQFLIDNKPLLVRNDFDTLYKRAASTRGLSKQLTEFLYNVAKIDPLPHMTALVWQMFYGVAINRELIIPANIKVDVTNDSYIMELNASSLVLECEAARKTVLKSSINKIIYKGSSTRIPTEFIHETKCEKIILPDTVTRIGSDAFSGFDGKIITPYREDPEKRLIIPKNEIDWYREHLRFAHAPKESEVEDGIKEN